MLGQADLPRSEHHGRLSEAWNLVDHFFYACLRHQPASRCTFLLDAGTTCGELKDFESQRFQAPASELVGVSDIEASCLSGSGSAKLVGPRHKLRFLVQQPGLRKLGNRYSVALAEHGQHVKSGTGPGLLPHNGWSIL